MSRNKDRMESLYSELESRYGVNDDLVQDVKAAIPPETVRFSATSQTESAQAFSYRYARPRSIPTESHTL